MNTVARHFSSLRVKVWFSFCVRALRALWRVWQLLWGLLVRSVIQFLRWFGLGCLQFGRRFWLYLRSEGPLLLIDLTSPKSLGSWRLVGRRGRLGRLYEPVYFPNQLWNGRRKRAEAILVHIDTMHPELFFKEPRYRWVGFYHFSWLRDFRMLAEDPRVCQLVGRLMSTFAGNAELWVLNSWRPDIVSVRITHWLIYYDVFLQPLPEAEKRQVQRFLYIQTRWLRHYWWLAVGPLNKITALKGIIIAELCQTGSYARREEGSVIAKAEANLAYYLARAIHHDGGLRQGSPFDALRLLRDLLTLRDVYTRHLPHHFPDAIYAALYKIAPFVQLVRLGRGEVACFEGGAGGTARQIERLLALAPLNAESAEFSAKTEAASADSSSSSFIRRASQTGYVRLETAHAQLVMDVGSYRPAFRSHAGALSINLALGGDTFVSNFVTGEDFSFMQTSMQMSMPGNQGPVAIGGRGSGGPQNGTKFPIEWDTDDLSRHASHFFATRYHSCVELDGKDSSGLRGFTQRWARVSSVCRNTPRGIAVQAEHDGYQNKTGHRCRRVIELFHNEKRVVGRDSIVGTQSGGGVFFTLRFYLSRNVQVQPCNRDGRCGALLTIPRRPSWLFVCHQLHTEAFTNVRNHQKSLCLRGRTRAGTTSLDWQFLEVS